MVPEVDVADTPRQLHTAWPTFAAAVAAEDWNTSAVVAADWRTAVVEVAGARLNTAAVEGCSRARRVDNQHQSHRPMEPWAAAVDDRALEIVVHSSSSGRSAAAAAVVVVVEEIHLVEVGCNPNSKVAAEQVADSVIVVVAVHIVVVVAAAAATVVI